MPVLAMTRLLAVKANDMLDGGAGNDDQLNGDGGQ